MRWLKRGLWLTVWGVWALAGYGLYWQLPREIGPKVGEVSLGGHEVVGFIKATHELLAQPRQFIRPIVIKIYNAETGGLSRDVSLDDRLPQLPLASGRTHGVVVARGQGRQMAGLEVLDLATARWTRVTDKMAVSPALHPQRPWIAFRETSGPAERRRPLAVVDWTTGREVFALQQSPELVSVGAPFFLGDGERLALPVVRRPTLSNQGDAPAVVEVWRIESPSGRERTVSVPNLNPRPRVGGAGRITWLRQGKTGRDLVVFDLDEGRERFAMPWEWDDSVTIGTEEFLLSRSGRTLVGLRPMDVWDVDARTPRWALPPDRTLQGAQEADDAFLVHETWDLPWFKGRFKHWNTVALHDLDTAAFRFRCWSGDAEFLTHRSDDGAFGAVVGSRNWLVIHQSPYRINRLLLGVCLAVLTLPLVLLWAMLRWARRRRAG